MTKTNERVRNLPKSERYILFTLCLVCDVYLNPLRIGSILRQYRSDFDRI